MNPMLILDHSKAANNVRAINKLCTEHGIALTGVIKGCNGMESFVDILVEENLAHLGSSRVKQLEAVKKRYPLTKTMLLRIPMISELDEMIRFCDISLQSEVEIIEKTNQEAIKQNIVHSIILMMDLGDLREGFFNEDDLIDTAIKVENEFKNLILEGIGTNLGCYGAVSATEVNMGRLVEIAEKIELKIGRKLNLISGGATSSLPLVIRESMPKRINNLRVGEAMLTSRELEEFFGYWLKETTKDAFVLEAEIIEIKTKPTHPIGELAYDAFGNKPSYEDRGIKKRMLLAVGRQDFGQHEKLIPLNKAIEIIGSSSDHLIVEINEAYQGEDNTTFKLGDTLKFELFYPALLYLSESPYVTKVEI